MHSFKKTICLFMIVFLVLGFAGCNSYLHQEAVINETADQAVHNPIGQTGESIDNWLAAQKKKWHIGKSVNFQWYVNYPWWQYGKKWQEYPVLKEVSEITGVVPEVSIPSGNAAEKLSLMIATNQLPDMITLDLFDSNVDKLIKQDKVYSFDELIEKYEPGFKNEISEDVYNYTKSEIDGKLYGLPSFFVPQWRYDKKIDIGAWTYNVRKDIYRELGSPDMSTPEKFIDALKKFKEKYPVLDGKASIPLSLGEDAWSIMVIEASFGIKNLYVESDTKVYHKYRNPNYIEVVKFLNRLYREGLLDDRIFMKKLPQLEEDWASNVFAVPLHYFGLDSANGLLDSKKPESHFIAVEPMKAVPEIEFSGLNRLGWTISMITKKAKDPEALIKFARYMWSPDGNLLIYYGHEGEHYFKVNNTLYRAGWVADERARDFDGFSQKTGIWTYRFFYYEWFRENTDFLNDDLKRNTELANKYASDWTKYDYRINPEPTSIEGVIHTRIWDIIDREYPKVILADTEEQAVAGYHSLMKMLNEAGLDQLEQFYTERYRKNIKKFGNK